MDQTGDLRVREIEAVVMRLQRRLRQELGNMLDDGITPAQLFVLYLAGCGEANTVSAISELMGVTLSAVTSLCDRLVASGLLTRERDETDRRLVRIALTGDGCEKLRQYQAKQAELTRRCLAMLTPEDADYLLDILKTILSGIEDAKLREEKA